MASEICAYDRSNPLLKAKYIGQRVVTDFEPEVALRVCEAIAEGKTLTEIFHDNNRGVMCSQRTFFQWVINFKECAQAYNEARSLSAYVLEDAATGELKDLVKMPGSPQKVGAVRALVDHYKWQAARRNPTVFSEKAPVTLTVPIQINTSLDMGRGDGAEKKPDVTQSVYTLSATVEALPEVFSDEPPFALVSGADVAAKPRLAKPIGRPKKQTLTPKGKT